ncbi:MAG: lytic transglycosylase domain-containing protein [Pseudomonadota bacterium]
MKRFLHTAGTCLLVPPLFFVMLAFPLLSAEIGAKQSLLTLYQISRQLKAEIRERESLGQQGGPLYGSIIRDYGPLAEDSRLWETRDPAAARHLSPAERVVARLILMSLKLPSDFYTADPVREIRETVEALKQKEASLEIQREEMVRSASLDQLKYGPRPAAAESRRGLPQTVTDRGLVFCRETIPLARPDVRRRIESEIDYLLTDLRETTGLWLKRKDRYGCLVGRILEQEGVPKEFALLPALESGYTSSIKSPTQALGWWQFVKPTAKDASKALGFDWTLRVDKLHDERCDLVLSTRAAARYLRWLCANLQSESQTCRWLTVAAAYNAGLSAVQYRSETYRTNLYWDMKLPLETENYVPRWIAIAIIDGHRAAYDIQIPPLAPLDCDTLENLTLKRDLPLSVLATITESSVRFIRELNPGLRKAETMFKASLEGKGTIHTIHVPKGWRDRVLRDLESAAYLSRDKTGNAAVRDQDPARTASNG